MDIHSTGVLLSPLVACLYVSLALLKSRFDAAEVLGVHRDLLLQRSRGLSVYGPSFLYLVIHCYVVIRYKCLQFLVVLLESEDLVSHDKAPFDVLVVQKHRVIDLFDLFIYFVIHFFALFFHVNFINLDLLLHLLEESLLFVHRFVEDCLFQ